MALWGVLAKTHLAGLVYQFLWSAKGGSGTMRQIFKEKAIH